MIPNLNIFFLFNSLADNSSSNLFKIVIHSFSFLWNNEQSTLQITYSFFNDFLLRNGACHSPKISRFCRKNARSQNRKITSIIYLLLTPNQTKPSPKTELICYLNIICVTTSTCVLVAR